MYIPFLYLQRIHDACAQTGGGGKIDMCNKHKLYVSVYDLIEEYSLSNPALQATGGESPGVINVESDDNDADGDVNLDNDNLDDPANDSDDQHSIISNYARKRSRSSSNSARSVDDQSANSHEYSTVTDPHSISIYDESTNSVSENDPSTDSRGQSSFTEFLEASPRTFNSLISTNSPYSVNATVPPSRVSKSPSNRKSTWSVSPSGTNSSSSLRNVANSPVVTEQVKYKRSKTKRSVDNYESAKDYEETRSVREKKKASLSDARKMMEAVKEATEKKSTDTEKYLQFMMAQSQQRNDMWMFQAQQRQEESRMWMQGIAAMANSIATALTGGLNGRGGLHGSVSNNGNDQ